MNAAKRFYAEASVITMAEGFGVMLDARALKTPIGGPFVTPTRALAQACAAEWAAQAAKLAPATMPLTRLAFAAIDGGASRRTERIAFILKYAETDLCCHRADTPAELAARQAAAWDPLVVWGREELGVDLPVVTGVVAAPTDVAIVETLRVRTQALDDFRLAGLAHGVGLSGAVLIGLALLLGRVDAAAAFAAAAVDDQWNLEHWGEDCQARARLDRQRRELEALALFLAALEQS